MYQVQKRDGKIVDFDLTKIKDYEYYGEDDYYYDYAKNTCITLDSLDAK